MPLSAAQQSIAEAPQRFKVAICGRRWGKTTLAIQQMAWYARQPNRQVFYVAPSYRQAKMIAWRKLKQKLLDLRWVSKVNESTLELTLKNNSLIALKGAENYDSLRGVGLDYLVMDEFAIIDEQAFTEVLRPALSDRQGHALFISTPAGMNWAKDLYDLSQEFPEEWGSWTYTSLQGGNIPEAEIEAARRTLDPRTFRQEYEATWETFEGRVYYAFERLRHLKAYTEDTPYELHIGLDFNISPMSAVIAVKTAQGLHIIDEIRLMGSNTDEMVQEIRNRYPSKRIVCYPDPAGAARKTSASGRTDHTILRNAGFTVLAPHSHNPVRDGINAVNSLLLNSQGITRCWISPLCKYTIESLEKLTYKENSMVPDKGEYDHFGDALRYMVDYLFPIKAKTEPPQVRLWSHKLG